ncbi:MAG: TA system VapC family ribonuclease toxin [Acidobacteriota bacterium]
MILIDTNLLVYARMSSFPQHAAARDWLVRSLNDRPRVGLPWHSLLGFLRVVTNSRIFERPDSIRAAWAQVEAWLDRTNVWIPQPEEGHSAILGDLLTHTSSGANLIPDAHLAALAIEHGLTLYSADGDFARFRELKWVNPLRR